MRIIRVWVSLLSMALLTLGPQRSFAGEPKRARPDYEGRGGAPTTAGDVALWVPRVLFSPVYFVTEFVIRRPLGALVSGFERAGLPRLLYDFFLFGPDHEAGIVPVAFIDFGFNPSVGIYTFWDDAFFKGNDLRFHGSVWSSSWIAGALTERIHFAARDTVAFHLSAVRRPDHQFYGIGPRSLQSQLSRYGEDRLEGGALVDFHLWRSSRIETGAGLRDVSLYHGHFDRDPSVEQSASAGVFPLPYGFGVGYTSEYNRVYGALDSREWRAPASGGRSGVRVELEAEQGSDVRQSSAGGWIRYRAAAGGFYDIGGHGRVVSLSATTLFADPLGTRPVPFTELAALGGDGPMRGFLPGRLGGRSAAAATARYTWPIWVWLDGSLEAAVGNVFGEHLDDFSPALLRFSAALGVESIQSPDNSVQILVGIGTETFEHGGQVDSARFLVGTNRGF